MTPEAENKILREMIEFVEDSIGEISYWYDEKFTTEEFGDEMLSCYSWWEKKKTSLEGDKDNG